MKTRILMMASAVFLAAIAMVLSFAPTGLLAALDLAPGASLAMLMKLMAGLYLGFAMVNWTAKDNMIGGIYARPVSAGNFIHFMVGSLVLLKFMTNVDNPAPLVAAALAAYVVFAGLFGWLVFGFGGACVVAKPTDD